MSVWQTRKIYHYDLPVSPVKDQLLYQVNLELSIKWLRVIHTYDVAICNMGNDVQSGAKLKTVVSIYRFFATQCRQIIT